MSKFTLFFFFWLFVLEWNKWRTWYVCVQCIFLMLPFWISFECIFVDSGVFIYITWRFFDVKEYKKFKSILISSVPVYISTSICRFRSSTVDIWSILQVMSCMRWGWGLSWTPPTHSPTTSAQSTNQPWCQ